MKNKKETNIWVTWSVILVVIILLFFLSISIYKEFLRRQQVESQIESLKEQAEKIKKENMTLEERIAYLGSQDYQKVQARDKLDLQDPKENVVVITQDFISSDQDNNEGEVENSSEVQVNYSEKNESNPSRWWNYFFK